MTSEPAIRHRPARDPEAGGNLYVGPSLGRSLVGGLVAIARGVDLSDVGGSPALETRG
jgi:hypothetical protein